jgi:UDP:flavonoid glycosyltransferase YjiC (YdhE family)
MNREQGAPQLTAPANAVAVDCQASLVVCHGGHGTVARALAEGVPILVCPAVGDMAETGARVAWAGAGLMLPGRLTRPGPLGWAVRRILGDGSFGARAGAFAVWSRENRRAERAADLVERLAEH